MNVVPERIENPPLFMRILKQQLAFIVQPQIEPLVRRLLPGSLEGHYTI